MQVVPRRRQRLRIALAAVATGIVVVNVAAFMQARAMTHFTSAGPRTRRPEELDLLGAARAVLAGVNIPRPDNAETPASEGLPFEVHRFPTSGGQLLESWFVPGARSGPLVLLFHGYAASKSALLPVAAAIHALGYPALLVDFHGSGGSSGSGTSLGYLEADDVAAAVDFARHSWPDRRVVLYGFSMGGAAILRAVAVHGTQPDGVILEATFDSLLNTAKNRFHTLGLPATPLAQLLLFWGGVQWGFDAFALNPSDYAVSLHCPALMLQGDADIRVPPEQAEHLRRALADVHFVRVPGVPHMLIATAQPEIWQRAVGEFLARWPT